MKSKLPKLLIVDDERNMHESLKIVLESHGYKADTVESAEEGLKSCLLYTSPSPRDS